MDSQNRTFKDYVLLYIKGLGMGASDVIPGVSGGTIAFITGIYSELLGSIRSFTPKNFRLIFSEGFGAFWKAIHGNFLVAVLFGIGTSIFTLAKVVQYLLVAHPIYIWSFFFGLIMISTVGVLRTIKKTTAPVFISFAVGAVIAYLITVVTPAETTDAVWFIFLCGAIAICAMILPGISGSFILLLLGKYQYILQAVTDLNLVVLGVFACGAVIGILSFSHFLTWLLNRFHDVTIALLAGFMLGSLNKVWPWKVVVDPVTLYEKNVLPGTYAAQTGMDSLVVWAVVMAALAIILYGAIELISQKMSKDSR